MFLGASFDEMMDVRGVGCVWCGVCLLILEGTVCGSISMVEWGGSCVCVCLFNG